MTLPKPDIHELGGELGALIRDHDWSATTLGPPEAWPQSLRTAVGIMLTARQPIWIGWGPELIYLYNDPYRSIIGGKHPWALGKPTRVVWSEIWPEIGPLLATASQGGQGTYVESRLLIMERNGYPEETYYTFSYNPIPDDDGSPGGIICANTDDTQRVIGERQLALLRELAARTADVRRVADACRLGAAALAGNHHDLPFALLYLCNEAGDFTLAAASGIATDHPAAPAAIAGDASAPWPLREVTAKGTGPRLLPLDGFDGLPSGAWSRPPAQAVLLPIPSAGEAGASGVLVAGLNPFRLFDEGYRHFLELVVGQFAFAIHAAQASEEERKRAEALAELDRAKTRFFSNVSHEFRTPLTLMLGPLEDALGDSRAPLADAQVERLQTALVNSRRLLKLVNTLLDFARVEAGRAEARFQPTDLAAFTAALGATFRSAMERARLRFAIDCPPLPRPAQVDRDMWEKIVLNLLSNAFKFTFEGGVELALRASDDGRHAELRVSDTGVGIPAEELPRVFERFHRISGQKGRSFEGSGIGLALVQELVRQHGGEITVASEVGRGSTFRVVLPFGRDDPPAGSPPGAPEKAEVSSAELFVEEALRWVPQAAADMAPPSPPPRQPGGSAPEGRILVADDNADMRDYLRRLLAPAWQVEAVGDGHAALAAIRRQRPDLVLTDVMMPGLDGFGLLRAIRADEGLADLAVIMLSARAGEEARVEGLEVGADDYLTKPFSAVELVARVRSNLQLGRLRRETAARLRESEARFRNMADHAPMMMWVTDQDGRCTYLNRGWREFTGRSEAEHPDIGWLDALHPADRGAAEAAFAEANERHEPLRLEARLRGADGDYHWSIIAAAPRFDDERSFLGFVGSVIDISPRKRIEALQIAQSRFLEAAIRDVPLGEVLDDLVRTVESLATSGMVASILLLDEDGRHLRHGSAPSLPAAYNRAIDGLAVGTGSGSCGAAVARQAPVHVSDIANDPLWTAHRELALSFGLRACWSTPILSSDRRILGTFAMYYHQPMDAPASDRDLVDFITRSAALVLERRRAHEALGEQTRRLEALNRTATALAGELDLERLVQTATDAGVELTGAAFGAFFYNVVSEAGESYTLYTLSGVDRSAFERFPMPRNTAVFGPTFSGESIVRSDDITADPRYGRNEPYRGMPEGHLPVRSYLAVPVRSTRGEVVGGLFFGHPEPRRFNAGHEALVTGIAGQAAVAFDNARLFRTAQEEIAQRRQAQAALNDLNARLEERVAEEVRQRSLAEDALRQSQKMEAIGQLTGGVAHDFNNLLQVISGNLQLLSWEVAGKPKARERVEDALAAVSRGAKLASQLLAFGRRQPLEPKVIDIGRFMRGFDDMLRRTLGAEIEVETIVAGGLWNTFADPTQVENALLNLAINARDAMDGRGKLTLEVSNAFLDHAYARVHPDVQPGQYVLIAVTDTGCGMSPETLGKAFEPFFTTKSDGRGTGLGLSQVYGFARQTGGHVKIYSEAGHGTCVRLYLPRSTRSVPTPVARELEPVVGGQETILVVEDDDAVRAIVVDMLTNLGYRVLKAPDAASALAIVESGVPIDLLFTDVVMPGPLRSTELARLARERLPKIAVLFTSGYAENAIVHHGRLDDGVSLIGKPYSGEDLARRVRESLAEARRAAARPGAADAGDGSAEAKLAQAPLTQTPLTEVTLTEVRLDGEAPRPEAVLYAEAGARRRILLVEDEPEIRSTTVQMLQLMGYEVTDAGDAEQALQLLESADFDLLLTDVHLPRADGETLARAARERHPRIGIVFATGDEGLISDRARLDGAHVLPKPYDMRSLAGCVAKATAAEPDADLPKYV